VRKIPSVLPCYSRLSYVLDYIEELRFEDDDIEYLQSQGFDEEFLSSSGTSGHWRHLAMPEGSIAFR